MDEIKDKVILTVKKAITNRAEVVDCYHDIMEIDCNDVDHIAEEVADALIAANIGDITAWKERAEKAENTELRERLNRAGELPCKVGDTLYEPFIDRIREWIVDSIYVFSLGINVNCERKDDCRWHDHFAIREKHNDFEGRVYLTRESAEARLKELQGGER